MRDARLLYEHQQRENLRQDAQSRAQKYRAQLAEHAPRCGHCKHGYIGRCKTGSELRRVIKIAEIAKAAHRTFKFREEEISNGIFR